MTTYEKSAQIIAGVIEKHRTEAGRQLAVRCLDALRQKRIVPHMLRASEEMFTRFHAHCRHLGDMTGQGYGYYRDMAVKHAMKTHDWPVKVITYKVALDSGDIVEVDIPVPESSTRARTSDLMVAYSVIVDEAARAGVKLPENPE